LFNPWIILAIVVAIAGAAVGGYRHGYSTAQGEAAIAQNKAVKQALVDFQAQQEKDQAVSVKTEQKKEAARVVFRTITQEVEKYVDKPIYKDCVLDADVVRLLNLAGEGRYADPEKTPAGKPDESVPGKVVGAP